ncbi:MAG: InlB B-repeat-containing protein [Oscillospiraceae bacterium]|nr:InlB B-repeat-containing protein [Oscillospiraceae bacterium]
MENNITINTNGTVNVKTEEAQYESFGIHSRSGNVAITGTNTTVNYGGAERHSARGIHANEGNGTVSISGANVSVTGTGKADNENNAVYGNLTISKGSVVNLKSGDSDNYDKYSHAVSGNVTINNSTVTLDSTASDEKIASGDVTIDGYPYNYMTQTTAGGKWTVGGYNPKDTSYLHVESAQRYIKLHGKGGKTAEGKTETTAYFAYGAASVDATNPFTRDGYTFDGWTWKADGKEMEDILKSKSYDGPHYSSYDLYAVWKPITYTITYSGNGGIVPEGTVSPDKITLNQDGTYTQKFTIEDTFNMVNLFTKEGYHFNEWSCSANADKGNTDPWPGDLDEQTELSELTGHWKAEATWTPNTYTVKFDANGGRGEMEDQTFTYDEAAKALTQNRFTKSQKVFAGWSTDKNAVESEYEDGEAVRNLTTANNGTVTLYAVWGNKESNVTLDPNGGTIADGKKFDKYFEGVVKDLPTKEDMSREHYEFDGWYDSTDETKTTITQIPANAEGKKTYIAKWSAINYTLKFDGNGGKTKEGVTGITGGESAYRTTYTVETQPESLPNHFEKAGYTFEKWYWQYDNEENLGYQDDRVVGVDYSLKDQNITGNFKLKAKWTANTYTVKFDANGGSGKMEDQIFTYDETKSLTANTFNNGDKIFVNWNTQADGKGITYTNEEVVKNLVTSGEITLYAMWGDGEFNVKLDPAGGAIDPDANFTTYIAGVAKNLPTADAVTKEHYTFAGWYDKADATKATVTQIPASATGDKEYIAKWTPNTYKVTLDPNGGTVNSGNVTDYDFGETTKLPTDVTKPGCTFAGWYDEDGNKVSEIPADSTGDRKFTARWTPNTYKVTLDPNGGTINSGNVTDYDFGETIKLPTNVTKPGCTFAGWYDEDGNKVSEIPADSIGDRKFTAKWYLAADDTSPVTGDTSSIQFWTILLVTSLAAIVVLIVFSNKKRSNRV